MRKENRGGARLNAGRKPLSVEVMMERAAKRAENKRQIMNDELLYPAVAAAIRMEAKGYDKPLEVALSAKQIQFVYGEDALKEWKTYFSVAKPGGQDTKNTAYVTRWKLNMNKFFMIQRVLRAVGKDIEDLPEESFPPTAMADRVEAYNARLDAKRLKKLEVIWTETENKITQEEEREFDEAMA